MITSPVGRLRYNKRTAAGRDSPAINLSVNNVSKAVNNFHDIVLTWFTLSFKEAMGGFIRKPQKA